MKRGTFWGVVLLVVGALLLLDNMDLLAFLNVSIWTLIWPAILIGLGVWVLVGATRQHKPVEGETWALAREGDSAMKLTLEYGAGEIFLAGGAQVGNLLDGDFEGGVVQKVTRDEDRTKVKLSAEWSGPWMWGPWQNNFKRRWDVRIDESIPTHLVVKSGASNCEMDLSYTNVNKLRVETGASSTEIKLPLAAGFTEVHGSGGAASIVLIVPEGVAARVRTQSGIAGVNVDTNRFPKVEGVYQSPDYATAANKVDIHLEMGVGSLEVR